MLDEFKHSLVDERPDWSVRFFDDGQHLLSDMERREYDLVVSDIHLPGLSGGEFLRTVAQKAPETVRVVSYDLERQEDVMTHVDAWNQFITKPCEPDMLISVVEESLSLKEKPPGLSAVEVMGLCREKEISLMKAEDLVFGFNHGDVGGVLFRLWGLSGKVVEAVKFHHVPGRSLNKDMSVLAALHVAEMVSQPLGEGSYGQWSQEDANLDYMQSVGMEGDLIDWKRRVDEFE